MFTIHIMVYIGWFDTISMLLYHYLKCYFVIQDWHHFMSMSTSGSHFQSDTTCIQHSQHTFHCKWFLRWHFKPVITDSTLEYLWKTETHNTLVGKCRNMTNTLLKSKDMLLCSPVSWNAQSAFLPWQTCSFWHNSTSQWSILATQQIRVKTIHSHFHHYL